MSDTKDDVQMREVDGVQVPELEYMDAMLEGRADEFVEEVRTRGPEEEPTDEPDDEPEASEDEPADEGEADEPEEEREDEPTEPTEEPSGLSPEDEDFAFHWLARARAPRQDVNDLLNKAPAVALAAAKYIKDTQDALLEARRTSAANAGDGSRPSHSDPSGGTEEPPEEDRRDPDLELLRRELGDDAFAALERRFAGQRQPETQPAPAVDQATLATVHRVRERLILSGREELRDDAAYRAVLERAERLHAIDPEIGVEAAILEVAERDGAKREAGEAATQTRRRSIADAQPGRPSKRAKAPTLTAEEARLAYSDALIEGNRSRADEIKRQYSL